MKGMAASDGYRRTKAVFDIHDYGNFIHVQDYDAKTNKKSIQKRKVTTFDYLDVFFGVRLQRKTNPAYNRRNGGLNYDYVVELGYGSVSITLIASSEAEWDEISPSGSPQVSDSKEYD